MCNTNKGMVPLHNHTDDSIQDALPLAKELAMYARKLGFPAVAKTDHGKMNSTVSFVEACRAPHETLAPIKPLIGCCLGHQLLHTLNGVKPIQCLTVGEMVLTHEGRFRPVTRTMNRHYDGLIYGIKASQGNTVWITDEHPVMVFGEDSTAEFKWIRADELISGHKTTQTGINEWKAFVAFPRLNLEEQTRIRLIDYLEPELYRLDNNGQIIKNKGESKYDREITFTILSEIEVTKNIAWLIGMYVAEGSCQTALNGRPTVAKWTLNHTTEQAKAEQIKSILMDDFGVKSTIYHRPDKNTVEVHASHTVLTRFLAAMCGKGSANKRIPWFVYRLPNNLIQSFLDGYAGGDGRIVPETEQIIIRTSSCDIVHGLRVLVARLGYFGKAERRIEKNNKVTWTFCWSPAAKCRKTKLTDDYILMPIKSIETKLYKGQVYNVAVEEDHSYVTDFILHNCEIYTCPDRFDKSQVIIDGKKRRPKHNHLTLITKNQIGWKNLSNICAEGARPECFYYDPRTDEKYFFERAEGIICLSGCLGSELQQAALKQGEEEALKVAKKFKEVWGDDYYIEMHNHGSPEQAHNNPILERISKKIDAKMVVSNDVHYLAPEDWAIHDLLISMRSLDDNDVTEGGEKKGKKLAYASKQFWLKTQAEMELMFSPIPHAITNTLEVAEKVEDYFKLDVPHLLPSANVPMTDEKFVTFYRDKMPHHHPEDAYLAYLTFTGLKRLGHYGKKVYMDRAVHELTTIRCMNVTAYFLLQHEMIKFMQQSDILFGVRGSGVGSVVLYAIGVSDVDPIVWNLLFERFLNPGRGTQYNLDFSDYAVKDWKKEVPEVLPVEAEEADTLIDTLRDDAIKQESLKMYSPAITKEAWIIKNQGLSAYLKAYRQKQLERGEEPIEGNPTQSWFSYLLNICALPPSGSLSIARNATLPDVDTDMEDSRRQEVVEWARKRFGADHVAMIGTRGTFGAKAAVKAALKTSQRFVSKYGDQVATQADAITKTIPKKQNRPITIDEALEDSPDFAAQMRLWSDELEVAKRLFGKASHEGVHPAGVIVASVPVADVIPINNAKGVQVSAFDMGSVERMGLVKYDFLGLSTLQMLSRSLKMVEKRHKKKVDLTTIPLNDPKVLGLYAKGLTSTIFQCASRGMQKALKDVAVSDINDLVAILSLFRPGPLEYIPEYAQGKKNPGAITYEHPLLEKHLKSTYKIAVYQEQLMFIFKEMGGFSWQDVDKVRKAVSKKQGKDFEKACSDFSRRAGQRGITQDVIDVVLKLVEAFGGYAFNKCVTGDTTVTNAITGEDVTVKSLYEGKTSIFVYALGEDFKLRPKQVTHVLSNGVKPVYTLTLESGQQIRATSNHPFRTAYNWTNLEDLSVGDRIAIPLETHKASRHHKKTSSDKFTVGDVIWASISSIVFSGEEETFDLTVEEDHNFVANGIVVHNSHATGYALLSYKTAYMRYYYPAEWIAACMHVEREDEDALALYTRECALERITVQSPNVNDSGFETTVSSKGTICLPLTSIKGVGTGALSITTEQPFSSLYDMAVRARPNRGIVSSLAKGGALDCFPELNSKNGDVDQIMEIWNHLIAKRDADEKAAKKAQAAKYKPLISVISEDDSPEFSYNSGKSEPITRKPIVRKPKISRFSNAFGLDEAFARDLK